MEKFIALVPAYKPDSLMLGMLKELAAEGFSTVVINDGSGEEFNARFDLLDCFFCASACIRGFRCGHKEL